MADIAKLISVIVLFTSTFICGILPYVIVIKCMNTSKGLESWIGRLNCFVGGIFLGTSLLTLLPEAREILTVAVKDSGIHTEYPVSECLAGIGFLLVLILEHFVAVCHGSNNKFHFHNHDHGNKRISYTSEEKKGKQVFIEHNNKEHNDTDNEESRTTETLSDSEPLIRPLATPESNKFTTERNDKNNENFTKLGILILLIALSFHMIFDGLAVGLQETDAKVYTLLGTLTLHKSVVAFSVGLHLSSTFQKFKKLVIYMFFFSLVSPFGTLIGMAVTNYKGNQMAKDMASGILQSIACGTFLYITFFEVLLKELANRHSLLNTLLTTVGFAVSAATNFLESEH